MEDRKPAIDAEVNARVTAIRAEEDSRLAAQIADLGGAMGRRIDTSDNSPTRAEFDALLARLAVAEAEIEKLKGRGPDFEGAF